MPAPLDLPDGVYKNENKRWIRPCPKCGATISHSRRNYCVNSHMIKQPCKRCSNINNHPSGMVGSVRVAWYERFRKGAITRGYAWDITPAMVDELYHRQGGRCALSGLPIGWSSVNWIHTASIDRIDNSVGYTPENIRLVHKKVNMMRGTLSVEDFVEICKQVTGHIGL